MILMILRYIMIYLSFFTFPVFIICIGRWQTDTNIGITAAKDPSWWYWPLGDLCEPVKPAYSIQYHHIQEYCDLFVVQWSGNTFTCWVWDLDEFWLIFDTWQLPHDNCRPWIDQNSVCHNLIWPWHSMATKFDLLCKPVALQDSQTMT